MCTKALKGHKDFQKLKPSISRIAFRYQFVLSDCYWFLQLRRYCMTLSNGIVFTFRYTYNKDFLAAGL